MYDTTKFTTGKTQSYIAIFMGLGEQKGAKIFRDLPEHMIQNDLPEHMIP